MIKDSQLKFSYKEYQRLLKLPLEDKILRTEQMILSELKEYKRPMISCSWGKASIVMVHLIRQHCKKVLVVFANTGVEYKQTYDFRDKMLKEWKIENYFELTPIKTFWQCVKEYGYPKFRQMSRQGKNRTPKCCYYCKEKPMINFIKKMEVDLDFVGLQAIESMVRRLTFLYEGERLFVKKYGCRVVRPLMIWTNKDIWDYHKKYGIPKNEIYNLTDRNGCMPCTGFKNWQRVMKKTNPRMFQFVSRKMGNIPLKEWCK